MLNHQDHVQKTYFKMYKAGKRWLVAGITLLGMGAAFGVATPAKADVVPTAMPDSAQPSSQTVNSAQNIQAKQVPLKATSAASQAATANSVAKSTTSQVAKSAAASQNTTVQTATPAKVVKTATGIKATVVVKVAPAATKSAQSAVPASSAAKTTPSQAAAPTSSTSNATSQTNESVQSNAASTQSTATKVTAPQVNTNQTVTGQQAAKPVKTVNTITLAPDANDADVAAAKLAAKANFEKTGQAQQIVRMDAVAANTLFADGDFDYIVNADGVSATLQHYAGTNSVITVPSQAVDPTSKETLTVTAITDSKGNSNYGTNAWKIDGLSNNANVTQIVLPDTIKTIGSGAIAYDPKLTTINIPDSVETIGDHAFLDDQLSHLTIGDNNNITSIGDNAFSNSSMQPTGYNQLGRLVLNKITHLSNAAFAYSGLTSVALGNNLTDIPSSAFQGNFNLTSVTLPTGLKTIGSNAFNDDAIVGPLNFANVTSIGDNAFISNRAQNALGEVDLPNIKTLGQSAFQNAGVTKLSIGNGLTDIPLRAFASNTSLTSVTLPTSLAKIEDNAFLWAASLTNIKFPDSVTSIGTSAFQNAGLTSITLPAGLTNLGITAFQSNAIAGTVIIPNGITKISTGAFLGNGISKLFLPNGLTQIGDYAFQYNKLLSLSLPNSVTTIGDNAFANNLIAGQLTLPNQLTSLGDTAFYHNNIMGALNIPDSLTTIPYGAFANNKIQAVSAPSVQTIKSAAFTNNLIKNIVVPATVKFDSTGQGVILAAQQPVQLLPPRITKFSMPFGMLGLNKVTTNADGSKTGAFDDFEVDPNSIYTFDSTGASDTTAPSKLVSYDATNHIFTIDQSKGPVSGFIFNFKDTTTPDADFQGVYTVQIDCAGIHLKSAADGTPNTLNIKVNDPYTLKDSIESYTGSLGDKLDLSTIPVVKPGGMDPKNPRQRYIIDENDKTAPVGKPFTTDKPGTHTVVMTINGSFQPTTTNGEDLYQVTGTVNVNQTYSWKFISNDGADLTDAIDPTTNKVAVTSVDKPDTNYTVTVPKTLTKDGTTYYLIADTNTDDLAYTNPTATFKYTTDAAAITANSTAEVKLNTTWDPAVGLASVNKPNGIAMTRDQIEAAFKDGTITMDTPTFDTSQLTSDEPTNVTYTYHYGKGLTKVVSADINVVQAPVLQAADETVFLNDDINTTDAVYDSTDEVGNDLDADGTILVNGKAVGKMDTSKVGSQTFNYSYQDPDKLFSPVLATATITVVDDTAIVTPATYYVTKGTQFDPLKVITELTNLHNKDLTFKQIQDAFASKALTIKGSVDTSKLGSTPLTFSYQDGGKIVSQTTNVKVVDTPVINVVNKTIGLGGKYHASMLFTNATSELGQALALKKGEVTAKGTVNTNVAGDYPVTFSYSYETPAGKKVLKTTATVTVKDYTDIASTPTVNVLKDTTDFDPVSLVTTITRADGTILTATELKAAYADGTLRYVNTYDLTKPGSYPITFFYKGHESKFSQTTINVVQMPEINVKTPYSLPLNSNYGVAEEEATLKVATDENGKPLALDHLTVTQNVDTKVPGTYDVTYTYQDAAKLFAPVSNTAKVTISDGTSLATDSATKTLTQGTTDFDPYTLITTITDTNGNQLTASQLADAIKNGQLKLTSTLDATKLGMADLTFSYNDGGKTVNATAKVNVVKTPVLRSTHKVTVNMNTSYSPADTYDTSSTDEYGKPLPLSAVAVSNLPDLNTQGTYYVTYQYQGVSTVTEVYVHDAASMTVNTDVTVKQGSKLDPLTLITSITKPNGAPMTRAELEAAYRGGKVLTVTGVLNTDVPGEYTLTFSYDDPIIRSSKITVIANSQPNNNQTAQSESTTSTPASQATSGTVNSMAPQKPDSQAGSTSPVQTNSNASQQPSSQATSMAPVQTNSNASQQPSSQAQSASPAVTPTTHTAGVTSQPATLTNTPASQATPTAAKSPVTKAKPTTLKLTKAPKATATTGQTGRTGQGDVVRPVATKQATTPVSRHIATVTVTVKGSAASHVATNATTKTNSTTQPVIHLTKPNSTKQAAATKLPQTSEQPTSALLMAMVGMSLLLRTYFLTDQKRYLK